MGTHFYAKSSCKEDVHAVKNIAFQASLLHVDIIEAQFDGRHEDEDQHRQLKVSIVHHLMVREWLIISEGQASSYDEREYLY